MKKKIIIAVVVLAIIATMVIVNVTRAASEDGDKAPTFGGGGGQAVEAQYIVSGDLSASVLVTGLVEEIEEKSIYTDSPLDVLSVDVELGDVVVKGQTMFTLDLSTLESELSKTKINYDIQTLQLEKLQHMASSTGSAQIGVELARLTLASAERSYNTQKDTYEKNQLLFEQGVISKSELDAIQTGFEEAANQLSSAQLSLSRSQSEMNTSEESTEIDIAVQVKNLESLDLTIAGLEQQIADLKALAEAPMNGVVTYLPIEDDTMVNAMTSIATVTNVEELRVEANVREYDIKSIQLGQQVILEGDAVNKGNVVLGEISFIAPIANKSVVSGREATAVEIYIDVTEGTEFLRPGYSLECEIMTDERIGVPLVNYNMLTENKNGDQVVYVVNENGKAEERVVELGITSDFDAEVISGVETGEVVIVNPSLIIKDGLKVSISNDLEENETTVEGE